MYVGFHVIIFTKSIAFIPMQSFASRLIFLFNVVFNEGITTCDDDLFNDLWVFEPFLSVSLILFVS